MLLHNLAGRKLATTPTLNAQRELILLGGIMRFYLGPCLLLLCTILLTEGTVRVLRVFRLPYK